MSAVIMEAQLLAHLTSDPDLAARGCTAERLKDGGIAIVRGGHHRGLWVWRGGMFSFTPGGYTEPTIEVETAAEAVLHTHKVICPAR